jgi:hypothetical protein
MGVGIAGQIDWPFLAQFRPSLTEVSKSLDVERLWRWQVGSPVTMTPIYHLLSEAIPVVYLLIGLGRSVKTLHNMLYTILMWYLGQHVSTVSRGHHQAIE